MTARCEGVVITLLKVAQAYKKFYCFASQKKIEELVERYHHIGFSNRTLNRDLRWLEDNGYISRIRRIRIGADGRLVFTSTLYKFTGKLFNWLFSMGNRVKRLFLHFRLPKMADYQLTQKPCIFQGAAASVQNLLITEKDGSVWSWNPITGDYVKFRN